MKKKQDKLHLLKGLQRILLDIDRAIQIIRETEEDAEVVPNLMIGSASTRSRRSTWQISACGTSTRSISSSAPRRWTPLEAEIADLEATVNDPKRIRKFIMDELTQ